jgi:hypothetical protein
VTAAVAGDDARRRLLVVPVRAYPREGPGFRKGIDEQITAARDWWSDTGRLRERAFDVEEPAEEIRNQDQVAEFVATTRLRQARRDDTLVLYVTGHGYRGPSGSHYLLMPDGEDPEDEPRPDRTAYPTVDLIKAALVSDARHVLIIVNTCYAAAIRADVDRLVRDLPAARRQNDTLAVIATADFDERPGDRTFAVLLHRVHEQLRTTAEITSDHLSLDQFLYELVRAARADGLVVPRRVWETPGTGEPMRCLPNPGFVPSTDVVAPALRQVADDASELDYWLDRASGRTDAGDAGWYFTGRSDLTGRVASFLAESSGILVITGAAGSGKSAVIARAVTLSDSGVLQLPRYATVIEQAPAHTLPPPDSIDVALLARNTGALALLTRLRDALSETSSAPVTGDPAAEFRQQIADVAIRRTASAERRPVTVVVDGLDESPEAPLILTDVIGPLAGITSPDGRPLIRMIIGVRSSTPGISGPVTSADTLLGQLLHTVGHRGPVVLRTDTATITKDLIGYADALLASGRGFYSDTGERARTGRAAAARVIAAHVGTSFLDTRLAAGRLRDTTVPQDLTDPSWIGSLTDGTAGQLRLDLHGSATTEFPAAHLAAVLRAAAFALGAGVPWADVWPAMTEAVLDATLPHADQLIRHVLHGRLGGYLVSDVEDGRVVHRLVHERLAEILRGSPHLLNPDGGENQ